MFRRFLERISDCAMFMLTPEGRVGSWNEGARSIFGYAPDEIVGRPVALFSPPAADANGLPGDVLASALSAERFEAEGWLARKDGGCFWGAVTISTIADDEGAVSAFGVTIRDLTERRAVETQRAGVMAMLEKTAGTDFLTGAANRRTLDATLVASIAAAERYGRPLSVAMVDVDRFKRFNDTQGHRAGDMYLQEAINSWRSVLRSECLLARYGGEEFTVVMPDVALTDAFGIMTRVREATPAPNTCSIGIAQWEEAESAESLVHRADRGLYAAKEAGRDRVVFGPAVESRAPCPELALKAG